MKFKNVFILLLIAFGLLGCNRGPQVQWKAYSKEVMNEAKAAGRPAVVDFYAAWCSPCMKMKETTFKDPVVIEALEAFDRVKMDMSFNRSEKIEKISEEFQINGLPTMIFFDGQGNEQARLSGFVSSDRLLKTVSQLKKQFQINSNPPPAKAS